MKFDTPLCKIAYKYGTDKCPQYKHSYTPYYHGLLKDKRNSIKKVLEVGIGYYENIKYGKHNWDDTLKRKYHKGASLKMWRDYFPNAQVYGADIKEDCIFTDERIETFVCDERKKSDVENLIKKTGSDIDLLVDDGSHTARNQVKFAEFTLPLLDKGVIYIIEDVTRTDDVMRYLKDYNPQLAKLENERHFDDDNLVVITK